MPPLPDTGGMESLRHVRTARLDLRAITVSDVDDLYALNSDPRVWTHPEVQGRGLATELAQAARAAALAVRPDLPVTALLLEHNLASKAVAEKLGLRLAWRGPDAGNPCPDAIRLVYADRELTPEVLGRMLYA